MQRHLLRQLHRLAWLDAQLASTGVHAADASKRLKTSVKTVRRELDLLHELSPLVYVEDDQFGRRRWFYADRRRRWFSQWFGDKGRK
jgi:predicted ArsR family transcriptional regulator